MNGETPTISSHDEIWALLPVDVRAEWEMHESLGYAIDHAARDTLVQAAAELSVKGYAKDDEMKRGDLQAALGVFITNTYDVPPAKVDLVFARAEEILIEEMTANG